MKCYVWPLLPHHSILPDPEEAVCSGDLHCVNPWMYAASHVSPQVGGQGVGARGAGRPQGFGRIKLKKASDWTHRLSIRFMTLNVMHHQLIVNG